MSMCWKCAVVHAEHLSTCLRCRYDVSWRGPIEVHKEWLAHARESSVTLITAHVIGASTVTAWRDGGMLGPDVLFSHCNGLGNHTELDAEAWKALKESGTAVGATPVGEIGMSYGNHVVFDAVEHGVKAGLGAVSAAQKERSWKDARL